MVASTLLELKLDIIVHDMNIGYSAGYSVWIWMTSCVHGAKILNLSRPVGLDYTVHLTALAADYICLLHIV